MPKKNAFFYFMLHYKRQKEAKGVKFTDMGEVGACAGKIWEKMDAVAREPFIQQSKVSQAKNPPQANSLGNQQSTIREKQLEKEAKAKKMNDLIAKRVKDAKNELPKEVFYVISVAYFGRTLQGTYLPAELGVVKFCLEHGVMDRMHMYINLSEIPVGAALSVNTHTKKTHNLPLPPNAFGTESSDEVAQCLLNFLALEEELPPLFTDEETLPIVEGMLRALLLNHVGEEPLYVFPLSELFDNMKLATERHPMNGRNDDPTLTAQYILKMDCYDYAIGISCDYHETVYNYLHCPLSQVTRWVYTITNACCTNLGIERMLGKHVPAMNKELMDKITTYESNSRVQPPTSCILPQSTDESLREEFVQDEPSVTGIESDSNVLKIVQEELVQDEDATSEKAENSNSVKVECSNSALLQDTPTQSEETPLVPTSTTSDTNVVVKKSGINRMYEILMQMMQSSLGEQHTDDDSSSADIVLAASGSAGKGEVDHDRDNSFPIFARRGYSHYRSNMSRRSNSQRRGYIP